MFVYNLLNELGTRVQLPMDTNTDSDAARLSAINPGTTARTKHYEVWMRYCRELYLKLMIAINWVPTRSRSQIWCSPSRLTKPRFCTCGRCSWSSSTDALSARILPPELRKGSTFQDDVN